MATVNMENWIKTRGSGYQSQEDPVPMEEVPPEIGHPQIKGGLGDKTPEQLENIITLADNHLNQIEEELHSMNPVLLLSDDQELPEEDADKIVEILDDWSDGLPELLTGISAEEAIAVSEALKEHIREVEPILVGAWLWRAGQLS